MNNIVVEVYSSDSLPFLADDMGWI